MLSIPSCSFNEDLDILLKKIYELVYRSILDLPIEFIESKQTIKKDITYQEQEEIISYILSKICMIQSLIKNENFINKYKKD